MGVIDAMSQRPAPPTAVGQHVRVVGWGGEVREWMAQSNLTGIVAAFTPKGNVVVILDGRWIGKKFEVAGNVRTTDKVFDRYGCFARIHDDGRWLTCAEAQETETT